MGRTKMVKFKILIILAALLLALSGCTPTEIDPYAKFHDFSSMVDTTGIDKDKLVAGLEKNFKDSPSLYLKGENYLILGHITNDDRYAAIGNNYFAKSNERANGEEKALYYETMASMLGSKYYHARAAWEWKKMKNEFRYRLNLALATGRVPNLTFDISGMPASYNLKDGHAKKIKIGESDIILSKNDILVSQTDRVTRDWLSYQIQNPYSENLLSLFSESLTYPEEELMPEIGWHEGGRIREMKSITGLTHKVATGTILAKKDGKWYAPNEKGVFMFDVPEDKALYPSNRPFSENLMMVIDTHGINMIVGQAIRDNASVVMGCCDHPGKIKAAKYLSDRGIKVICNTDRYVPLLLGTNANVLGSAPFERLDGKVIIGNRPIEIDVKEPIVVSDASEDVYGLGYYDTPARYFDEFKMRSSIMLDIHKVKLDDFNQMSRVIAKAEELDAKVIGVRVFNKDDYENVKSWLEKDIGHKAILFHSEPYPYGYKLAREFIAQTTFDDINPVII